jgi:hypothetical protein
LRHASFPVPTPFRLPALFPQAGAISTVAWSATNLVQQQGFEEVRIPPIVIASIGLS